MDWDRELFLIINRVIKNPVFDLIMPIVSELTWFIIPLCIVCIFLIVRQRRRGVILLVLTGLTITCSDQMSSSVIKPLLQRQRPCNELGNVYCYVHQSWQETPEVLDKPYKPVKSYSFPSSHATNTFAAAALWGFFLRGVAWWLFGIAAIVGFSRIYLGVHYPFDVIGGAIIGTLIGSLWYSLGVWYEQRRRPPDRNEVPIEREIIDE